MEERNIRETLIAETEATLARIQALSDDFDGIVTSSADSNLDDEHDPEGSTVAFERAQVAALLTEARAYLGELDRAFARLVEGNYSECERCGAQISAERLSARPAARLCIRCAASPPPT
jgi:RNA polymerase-binding transcription factor DksA